MKHYKRVEVRNISIKNGVRLKNAGFPQDGTLGAYALADGETYIPTIEEVVMHIGASVSLQFNTLGCVASFPGSTDSPEIESFGESIEDALCNLYISIHTRQKNNKHMTQPHREAILARVAFMEIYERWEKQQFGTKEHLLIGFYNECLDDDLRRAISSILESIQNAPPLADWQRWQQVNAESKVCHRCKTELVPGKALVNTLAGLPDFPGDNSPVTVSPTGKAVLIDCQKCPNCGQSYKY